MPTDDVVVKPVGPVRLAELTGTASSYAEIGPVVRPLCEELFGRLVAVGLHPAGPSAAYYEDAADGSGGVVVHAGLIVDTEPKAEFGFAVVDLPDVKAAATVVHRGSMENIVSTYQSLATWIDANGYTTAGPAREYYLECPADGDAWVTEIQFPVVPA